MSIDENPFVFGDDHPLLGILSEAESPQSNVGVLMLSSGLVHRAGPFRLGTTLARSITETTGLPVFRFDQSARGDSQRRYGVDVIEAAELDIRSAKEAFRAEAGVERIVIAGLCSGADDGIRHASVAHDIHGLILMDPYAPRTNEYMVRHYGPRLINPQKVINFATRKLNGASKSEEAEQPDGLDLGAIREFPSDEQSQAAYRRISDQHGHSLCVFTGGVADYYNHEGQLVSGLELDDISDTIEEVFLSTAEHTFPIAAHRRKLCELIADFCRRHFL